MTTQDHMRRVKALAKTAAATTCRDERVLTNARGETARINLASAGRYAVALSGRILQAPTVAELHKKAEPLGWQPAAVASCPINAPCSCPSCAATALLLRTVLIRGGVEQDDSKRVTITASACGDGSYPFLASVRVDDREVYRIMSRPDEVFAEDVMDDIKRALRRQP